MQLGDQRASGNVEDRRGMGIGGGLGVGGIVIALVAYFLGFDPSTVINVAEQVSTQRDTREAPKGAPTDEMGQFVSKVLGSTEDVWGKIFQQSNSSYRPPTLVLYDGQVRSACGMGQAAMGPFYCPERREALHRSRLLPRPANALPRAGRFRPSLRDRPRSRAPRAEAHRRLREAWKRRAARVQARSNQNSVRLELQADCYAGVWGHYADTMKQLDPGDIAEALNAATAIGDDRLQKQTQGRVVPECVHPRLVGAAGALVQARLGLGPARRTATRSRRTRCESAPVARRLTPESGGGLQTDRELDDGLAHRAGV